MKKLILVIAGIILSSCSYDTYSYPRYETPVRVETVVKTEPIKAESSSPVSDVVIISEPTCEYEEQGFIYSFPTYSWCGICHHYHSGSCYYDCNGYVFCQLCFCWHTSSYCPRQTIILNNRHIQVLPNNPSPRIFNRPQLLSHENHQHIIPQHPENRQHLIPQPQPQPQPQPRQRHQSQNHQSQNQQQLQNQQQSQNQQSQNQQNSHPPTRHRGR